MAETLREVPGFPDEAPHIDIFNVLIPKVAAKGSATAGNLIIPHTGAVYSASIALTAALAESATEYAVFEVITFDAKGENEHVAAKYTSKEGASKKEKLVANVVKALTLTETAANLLIVEGGTIVVKVTGTETKEIVGGVVQIKLARNVKETPKEQPGA